MGSTYAAAGAEAAGTTDGAIFSLAEQYISQHTALAAGGCEGQLHAGTGLAHTRQKSPRATG